MHRMEKLSPMLQQYQDIKAQYPDALILFRLGDFYELFYDDARIASYELDLVLTGRASGNNQKAPMCGVPFHAVSGYIKTLVNNGHKVALVEQLEEASASKSLVRRDVVKVVTPGTMTDEWSDEKSRNKIAALELYAGQYVLAITELMSGMTHIEVISARLESLKSLLDVEAILELVISSQLEKKTLDALRELPFLTLSYEDELELSDTYLENIQHIQEESKRWAYGRLMNHLLRTQKKSLLHLRSVEDDPQKLRMRIDAQSLRNLELIDTISKESKEGSLFNFLDKAQTAMGSRFLKDWIKNPFKDKSQIELRLNKVEALVNDTSLRSTLKSALSKIYDLERISSKLAIASITPFDVLKLSKSLSAIQELHGALKHPSFSSFQSLNKLSDLCDYLLKSIDEQAPAYAKDGGIFKKGFNAELDELRDLQKGAQSWLLSFEKDEKERTQIKNLKVGYNRVFGYYIEISKGSAQLVTEEMGYIRKQTLSNAERFITPLLKEKEDQILHAQESALRLELNLYAELLEHLQKSLRKIQSLSDGVGEVDAIYALAQIAFDERYVRPSFHEGYDLDLVEGRHPLLEKKIDYVSNSCHFNKETAIQILTGPNMGGKSTYMRQLALTVILAQMGSFVPAKKADLPLIDAIFTRMGASDDLMEGHSTFMVEMKEANTALKEATEHSLVLFDEIGRGTSTYDGMALAQAMLEYLSVVNQCKTIFSTHYHELTHLVESLNNAVNMHVEVHEEKNEVTFLYRVKKGKANKSYGVNVARLAHLPEAIIDRAHQLLIDLESQKRVVQQSMQMVEVPHIPKEIEDFIQRLYAIDVNHLTPMEALKILDDVKKEFKN